MHNYRVREKVLMRDKKVKIRGAMKKTQPNFQGLNKWNCYHTLGRHTIVNK